MLLGHLQAFVIKPIHWRSQKSSVGIQSYWLPFLLEMQTVALFQGLHYHLLITLSSYPPYHFILHISAKSSFSLTKEDFCLCVIYQHYTISLNHQVYPFLFCSDCNSKNSYFCCPLLFFFNKFKHILDLLFITLNLVFNI